MLVWSEKFKTQIEGVDLQHKQLFDLLNQLADSFRRGNVGEKIVEDALTQLVDYSNKHFLDEELFMVHHNLDPRHIALQRMEHQSFIYDVRRIAELSSTDEDIREKLVRFITFWLIYHIMETDMDMAAQAAAIHRGMTPEQAYEMGHSRMLDNETSRMLLDAVLNLWRESTERCRQLEKRLAALEHR
ncbi:MAG: bacteriohemerythrin [Methylococcaceae bacterium]|nr:bacteriohemerythrin [Methylococcaceae bacterium]